MYPGPARHSTSSGQGRRHLRRTGEVLTYAELDARSNRLAQLLWGRGAAPRRPPRGLPREPPALLRGRLGGAAIRALPHHGEPLPHRAGGRLHRGRLRRAGAGVVARGARGGGGDPRARARAAGASSWWTGPPRALRPLRELRGGRSASHSAEPLAEEPLGEFMLYSSGTTGRPKGIARPLLGPPGRRASRCTRHAEGLFRADAGLGLPLARAHVPLGAHRVHHRGAVARRHGGDDGPLRRARGARGLEKYAGHPQPVGARPCSPAC